MDHIDRSVDELTRAELSTHYVELQARSAFVLARLLSGDATQPDRTLDIEELEKLTGMSKRALFAKAPLNRRAELPFLTRMSRKCVIGHERALNRWLASRRAK